MLVTNIQWDIDIEEVFEILDEMRVEKAAEAIDLPIDSYANMSTEERHDWAYDYFHHRSGALDEFMDLPKEIKIPKELKDEDDISDWLSDTYGFCHKEFTIKEEDIIE